MFWSFFIGITCLKILLIPSYVSTDFEVHRNWLAITHSLPLSEWYTNSHSKWTLDYPPFFAWFEYFLSCVAQFVDRKMLNVANLNYRSYETRVFQRLTVIVSDFLLAYAVKECGMFLRNNKIRKCSKWKSKWNSPSAILTILVLGNAALLLIDHVHFQYNGFLFGVLLLSVARMLQDRKLESAFWFATLLNLKHIYMYVAPAYFVYLLRNYCFKNDTPTRNNFLKNNFAKLGSLVGFVFLISFGPFMLNGQFLQVLSRLFPFNRGLSHAYWAPNFWALYNALDRILVFIGRKIGIVTKWEAGAMSGGLVQEYEHSILPSVKPFHTLFITVISIMKYKTEILKHYSYEPQIRMQSAGQMPACLKLWNSSDNPLHFVRVLVICAFSSFLFGWHVHEKAILLPVIPLTIMSVIWSQEASTFLMLSTIASYSIFPLLHRPFELPIKVLVMLSYSVYAFKNLSQLYITSNRKFTLPMLNRIETVYIFSLLILFGYEYGIQHVFGLQKRWPFLPLMLTSVHNAVGVIYCYIKYYTYFLGLNDFEHKSKAY